MTEEKKVEQTEELVKTTDGKYLLTVKNYGDNENQTLTQLFTKETLKTQYELMKQNLHNNTMILADIKKNAKEYSDEDKERLNSFSETLNELKAYQQTMQNDARKDDILKQQEGIRRGMGQISALLPELARNK